MNSYAGGVSDMLIKGAMPRLNTLGLNYSEPLFSYRLIKITVHKTYEEDKSD